MDIVSVNMDNRLQIWTARKGKRARAESTNIEVTANADSN
jgi:hypothetical protein